MKKQLSQLYFWIIYASVIVAGILIDQLTKVLLEDVLKDKSIPIIGQWLMLSWTINNGAAFGGFQGANILFFIVTLLGIPLFGWLLYRSRTRSVWGQVGFAFIISGAIGNAIDRAFLGDGFFDGGVRDMIYVDGFAIFNIADSFLTVGVILAIFALVWADHDSFIKEIIKEQGKRSKSKDKPKQKDSNKNDADGE